MMDTQLSFLETEKQERNKANMVKIFTINQNQEEQASLAESLNKSIPNATVIMAPYDIECIKKIRAEPNLSRG